MELSLRQEIQLTGSGGCVTGVSLWTAGQVAVVWTSESQPSRRTEQMDLSFVLFVCTRSSLVRANSDFVFGRRCAVCS